MESRPVKAWAVLNKSGTILVIKRTKAGCFRWLGLDLNIENTVRWNIKVVQVQITEVTRKKRGK